MTNFDRILLISKFLSSDLTMNLCYFGRVAPFSISFRPKFNTGDRGNCFLAYQSFSNFRSLFNELRRDWVFFNGSNPFLASPS